MTILEFLHERHNGNITKPLTITKDSTLIDIINIMCDNNAHRVYMNDEKDGHPLTVTLVSDVLSILVNC
ncbi:hypothetical protein SAMD00019534_056930 [Acytostelium subglobosum LB1]|uniref:hypothetical protein n=1 Tax=Acytostelium subglobosum LB1 TaxID=1410327 RepID=UPI000644F2B7|nr:hypothetical protein SAMD00019534_056930 [Acytostelium subglobosum LB1]GAM22518.1 hypothetical protein SAMD00019534_056930 [Acytostelium subglobosum LB1]|eukprot:XP_012754638.1 hypothetical protein SAMD00019534_056930 [Acytostelium subglobosum LB1]